MKRLLSFIYLTMMVVFGFAQGDEGLLTIDRIFNSSEFRSQRGGSTEWLPDGNGYTALESSATIKNAMDIVKIDPKTSVKVILVSAENLTPQGLKEPLSIESYSWSPDATKLLIFTNGKQVWRYNTRGDYWVLDLASKSLYQLGKNLPASSLMFAKVSPDGTRAAYVSKHNI
jgi:dipeptidyl-peptidase-4